jgi:LEA14-like dessication related protein
MSANFIKKLNALVVFLASSLLFSCASLKEPEFRSIENIRFSRIGFKESDMQLDLFYYNPNKAKLKLKRAEGEAWVDSSYLGHFTVDSSVSISPLSEFRIPINLKVDMSRILRNSMSIMSNKEVLVKVKGTARVGKSGIYVNYPMEFEGKQNLGKMLQ